MKNLLLVLLFVLPTALFSASPSCLAGMEVSLVDPNGKVVKTGKFDNKGQLTLDGIEDVAYDIKLSNKGKSCMLNKPTEGSFSGLPTGKRQHKPFTFKISDQQGGDKLLPASNLKTAGRTDGNVEGVDDWKHTSKNKQNKDGVDQDCDDIEIQVTGLGSGKATFKEMTVTK